MLVRFRNNGHYGCCDTWLRSTQLRECISACRHDIIIMENANTVFSKADI